MGTTHHDSMEAVWKLGFGVGRRVRASHLTSIDPVGLFG